MKVLRLDDARSLISRFMVSLRTDDGPQRFALALKDAATYARDMDLQSGIYKLDWGQHRIWAAVYVDDRGVPSARPEIGSRYGEAPALGLTLEFLFAGWHDTAECFDDIRWDLPMWQCMDDLFDQRFAATPLILNHAREQRYDAVSMVRLIETLDVFGVEKDNELGIHRALRHVDAMRERIRTVFVSGKERFAAEVIRELR
jgi:hypothetical protein